MTTFSFKNCNLTVFKLFQRLVVPRIIDKFQRKRCQKKRKDVSYQLQKECFQKYFVVHAWSAVKNSFSTYVWSEVDSCFCESVYIVCKNYKLKKSEKLVHILLQWSTFSLFMWTRLVLEFLLRCCQVVENIEKKTKQVINQFILV